jgi:hypothetical protein
MSVDLSSIDIVFLTESEKDKYLSEEFHPYKDATLRLQLPDDWMRIYAKLGAALAGSFVCGLDGADVFLPQDFEGDRTLCIEVLSETAISPALLELVHDCVINEDSDFRVDMCNSWMYLEQLMFNIIVEKRRILAYSDSSVTLHRFGLVT